MKTLTEKVSSPILAQLPRFQKNREPHREVGLTSNFFTVKFHMSTLWENCEIPVRSTTRCSKLPIRKNVSRFLEGLVRTYIEPETSSLPENRGGSEQNPLSLAISSQSRMI